MTLPEALKQAIETECTKMGISTLIQGRQELSDSYRQHKRDSNNHMASLGHKKAYVVYRMPATYAVNERVLNEVNARIGEMTIDSLLDLGSGPGTAMWAAHTVFSTISKYTLVEQDADLIAMSKRFASQLNIQTTWKQQDLVKQEQFEAHDMVILSYVVNELTEDQMVKLIAMAWNAARKLLVIIEPGTPVGFAKIKQIRQQLIDLGGHPVAPCPHANACPMSGGDWCHFSQRLERSRMHRQIKQAVLSYEDEKFSYIAMSKSAVALPQARILRHPQIHSGHRTFELCTKDGLQRKTISRKDGDLYKQSKKLEWGDAFE